MNANIATYEYPTSKTFKDLSGQTIGLLHIDKYYGKDKRSNIYYECTCECGNKCIVGASSLKCGDTVSCGCYHKNELSKRLTKHGLASHPLYWVLHNMKKRCYNENNPEYHNYGARGIYICDEWLNKENGFINFYNWSMNNGYEKGLTIDRISVDGPYSPDNCRWVDIKMQNNNRRSNKYISLVIDYSIIGKEKIIYTYTPTYWEMITGISIRTITRRLEKGWSVEDALTIFIPKGSKEIKRVPIIITNEMLKYNQPEKYNISIHD